MTELLRLGIFASPQAMLPEVSAYRAYFTSAEGYHTQIFTDIARARSKEFDAVLVPFGFHPRLRPRVVLIADYSSLSTGRMASSRDFLKRHLNPRPDIAIYQNSYVRSRLRVRSTQTVLRPMGFFGELVEPRCDKEFDVVYAGTMSRPGVIEAINHLGALDLDIVVAGSPPPKGLARNVQYVGRLDIPDIYRLYARCTFGLNFVPPKRPYQFQASTKVIEYCASGLGVISNCYPWVNEFFASRGGTYLPLSERLSKSEILSFDFRLPRVSDLEWNLVMSSTRLRALVREACNERDLSSGGVA